MSNLLNAISEGLNADGVDRIAELTGSLGLQVENLSGLGTLFSDLMSDPEALTDLVRNLDEMALPGFDLDSGFGQTLSGLQSVLPTEMDAVLGPLLDGLDNLETSVIGDLASVVTQTVEAVTAILNLTQLRFGASAVDGPRAAESAPAEAGGGAPAEGGEAEPAGESPEPPEDTQSTAAALDGIDSVLDLLPADVGVKKVVELVAQVGAKRSQLPIKVPIIDELGDMIDTLLAWEAADTAGVQDWLAAIMGDLSDMLQSIAGRALVPVESELADVQSALRVPDLQSISTALQTQVTAVAAAVDSGDLSTTAGAVSALNAACDLQASVAADWTDRVQAQLAAWRQNLYDLPEALEDHISHRVQVLRPVSPFGALPDMTLPDGWAENSEAMEAFGAALDRYVAWLWDVVDCIDLQAIEEPLAAVADGAQSAVDSLDDAMVAVTMQVQSLFGEAEALIDQVNIEQVTARVVAAIDDFGNSITQQLRELTAPIREALEDLIGEVQGGLSSFDPAAVEGACRDVIDAVGGALNNESLQNIAVSIRNALETAAARIEELSFAPVADLVIAAIEEVTEALQSIDTSELDPILRAALDAAVGLLPGDIAALTDPLIDDLGKLIEEEAPLPQLAQVLEKPQQIMGFVTQYEPQVLLGTALSQPFEALLARLEAFSPSSMLRQPVTQVLDTLKARLRDNANPAQLLDPLVPLFDELIATVTALDPTALIQPIEQRLQALIDNLLEALHIEEVLAQLDAVLNKIQEILGLGDHVRAILQRLSDVLEGLQDARTQFNAWLNPIFDKLVLPDGDGPLAAARTELVRAVDALAAVPLQSRFDTAVNPVLGDLDALGADQLLVPAVQAFRSVSREALEAIPGFADEKAALLAVLDRCNPMAADFTAPFQGLADLVQGLRRAQTALGAKLSGWDDRWLSDDSALVQLRDLAVAGDSLRNQLADLVDAKLVRPFSALFDMAAPLRDALAPIISNLERLNEILQEKIGAALVGEDGLGGVRDAMNGLVARIDNFDLSFLTDSLQALFDNLKGKLEALSPAMVRDVVDGEFNQLLESIDLDLILPSEDPDPLDELFADLASDFAALHPDTLVVQPLQQSFEQDVLPLLEAFDLTPVIQALLDRLAALDDELKGEMQRVNNAYNSMLQAVP